MADGTLGVVVVQYATRAVRYVCLFVSVCVKGVRERITDWLKRYEGTSETPRMLESMEDILTQDDAARTKNNPLTRMTINDGRAIQCAIHNAGAFTSSMHTAMHDAQTDE